jgi:hypothetical protein
VTALGTADAVADALFRRHACYCRVWVGPAGRVSDGQVALITYVPALVSHDLLPA